MTDDPEQQAYECVQRALSFKAERNWRGMAENFSLFIALREAAGPASGRVSEWLEQVARAYSSLSTAHLNLNEIAAAVEAASRAVRLAEEWTQLEPANQEAQSALAFHLAYQGFVYRDVGKIDAALMSFQDSLAIYTQIAHTNLAADGAVPVVFTAMKRILSTLGGADEVEVVDQRPQLPGYRSEGMN